MATFLQAQTRLLLMVNRPSSEADVLAGVKDAINDAIAFLQRNHAYFLTERISSLTIPANTQTVDLSTAFTNPVRDLMSVQQVTAAGIMIGQPLKLMTYVQLQAIRKKYFRTHATTEPYVLSETLVGWTIEDGFRCDQIAFISGSNFGIYPCPNQDSYYILNNHAWMAALSADADTNFFLTYAYDVVITLALKRMHLFMKEDSRYNVTEQEMTDLLAGLIQWDAQLRESPETTLT